MFGIEPYRINFLIKIIVHVACFYWRLSESAFSTVAFQKLALCFSGKLALACFSAHRKSLIFLTLSQTLSLRLSTPPLQSLSRSHHNHRDLVFSHGKSTKSNLLNLFAFYKIRVLIFRFKLGLKLRVSLKLKY